MKKYSIVVNGKSYIVELEEIGGVAEQQRQQAAPAPTAKKTAQAPAVTEDDSCITAPMPGTVLDIKVGEGDSVKAGQVLIILEAMKMENQIMAPVDAVVDSIQVQKGASVNAGDILINMR